MEAGNKTTLLLKFGEREHMEQLKAGILYFSPVSKYRNDGTAYRGDINEGCVPIDPSSISIFSKDGEDLFADLRSQCISAKYSLENDDTLFMFCAAMITSSVLQLKNSINNEYIFRQDFRDEMKKFGNYVFLFHLNED